MHKIFHLPIPIIVTLSTFIVYSVLLHSQSTFIFLSLAATIPYLLSVIPQQIVTRHTIVLDLQHLNLARIMREMCCHAVVIHSQRRVTLGILITYTRTCIGLQMMLQAYGLSGFSAVCFIILQVIGTGGVVL
jgi:hypothetical protein